MRLERWVIGERVHAARAAIERYGQQCRVAGFLKARSPPIVVLRTSPTSPITFERVRARAADGQNLRPSRRLKMSFVTTADTTRIYYKDSGQGQWTTRRTSGGWVCQC